MMSCTRSQVEGSSDVCCQFHGHCFCASIPNESRTSATLPPMTVPASRHWWLRALLGTFSVPHTPAQARSDANSTVCVNKGNEAFGRGSPRSASDHTVPRLGTEVVPGTERPRRVQSWVSRPCSAPYLHPQNPNHRLHCFLQALPHPSAPHRPYALQGLPTASHEAVGSWGLAVRSTRSRPQQSAQHRAKGSSQ